MLWPPCHLNLEVWLRQLHGDVLPIQTLPGSRCAGLHWQSFLLQAPIMPRARVTKNLWLCIALWVLAVTPSGLQTAWGQESDHSPVLPKGGLAQGLLGRMYSGTSGTVADSATPDSDESELLGMLSSGNSPPTEVCEQLRESPSSSSSLPPLPQPRV